MWTTQRRIGTESIPESVEELFPDAFQFTLCWWYSGKSSETARTHVWPSNGGLAKFPASGRTGQTIGFSIVLATNVGDREIE